MPARYSKNSIPVGGKQIKFFTNGNPVDVIPALSDDVHYRMETFDVNIPIGLSNIIDNVNGTSTISQTDGTIQTAPRPINELNLLSGSIDTSTDKIMLFDTSTGNHIYVTPAMLSQPEVFRSNLPLSGAVPAGYNVGVDYTTGTQYYRNALNNRQAFPIGTTVVLTDLPNGQVSVNAGLGGVQSAIRPISELGALVGGLDNVNDRVLLYDASTGNHVYVTPGQLNINTTMAGVQATGKIIGTYTNEAGVVVNVRETITGITGVQATGTILGTYTNENGVTFVIRQREELVTFGAVNTAGPAGAVAGDEYVTTDTGTIGGKVVMQYIYNGTAWILRPYNYVGSADVRAVNSQPQYYRPGKEFEFKQATVIGLPTTFGTYAGLETFRPYGYTTDFSGGAARQEAISNDGTLKYYRVSTSATTRSPRKPIAKPIDDFDLQNLLQLNGTAKVSLNGEVNWSNRFITMTAGVRTQETSGYHDINMPAVGTAIPVSNGSTVIVTAATAGQTGLSGGIALTARQSLWYRIPKGSSAGIVAANFRIQNYSDSTTGANGIMGITVNPTQDASEWVLICGRDDNNQFRFGTGDTAGLGFQFGQGMDIQETSNRQSDKTRYLINGCAFRPRNLTTSAISFGFNGYIRTISTGGNNGYSNTSGYRDINVPAVGTIIYGVGGVANTARRATTTNDAMYRMGEAYLGEGPNASTPVMDFANSYQALWFAHDVNGGTGTGTRYMTSYANNFSIPPHWIFVAQRDESNLINLFTGERLNRGEFLRQGKREQILNKSRFTITSKGDFDCRFTQANFFAGTGANGLSSSNANAGALIHRQDNNGMMAAMDSDQGRPYTRLNIPAAGYAIPMLDAAGTRTRVVQTLGGRKYIPLSARETLIYIPQQNSPSSSTVDRGWFVVNYGDSRHIPANAMTIASWSADGSTSGSGTNKTRIKMGDGTYIQPGSSIAVGTPTRGDHAQGTMIGDWRNVIVAGSTPIAGTAPLPAVIGVAGNYGAPYTAKYKYQTTVDDPRGEVKLKGIIALNGYVIGTPNIAFIAGVSLFEQQIIGTIATGVTFGDAKPIYTQLRFSNGTVGGQNGILIQIYGGSMGATAPNWSGAGIPAWISLDNITLHLG